MRGLLLQLTPFLARKAFGESRIVRGVYNLSAVEAGVTTEAAVRTDPSGSLSASLRADLNATRSELTELHTSSSGKPAVARPKPRSTRTIRTDDTSLVPRPKGIGYRAQTLPLLLFGVETLSAVTTMLQRKQLLAIRPRDGQ